MLSHTSDVSGWDQRVTREGPCDWNKCTSLLEPQEPWWTPGMAAGYDVMTVGYRVGEVVRCITGRAFGRFFAEEIAGPLGTDFQIGLAASNFSRVANVVSRPPVAALLMFRRRAPRRQRPSTFAAEWPMPDTRNPPRARE